MSTVLKRQHVPAQLRRQKFVHLLIEGYNLKECSQLMDVTYVTVRAWLKEPDVRQRLQDLNSRLLEELDQTVIKLQTTKLERLDEMADDALETMKGLMAESNPHIRLKAAQDILDRTPEVSRQKKLDVTERKVTLDATELAKAALVAKEVERGRALEEARALAEANDDSGS